VIHGYLFRTEMKQNNANVYNNTVILLLLLWLLLFSYLII